MNSIRRCLCGSNFGFSSHKEMMDFGYPLTTEPNALKSMIEPPTIISRLQAATTGKSNISDVLPTGSISNMPWRKTDVKYSQNEIFVDIIEEVDAIIDRNGQLVSSEVTGTIMSNSRLSGVPDLTLVFTDPSVIDDCSFHPCVRFVKIAKMFLFFEFVTCCERTGITDMRGTKWYPLCLRMASSS